MNEKFAENLANAEKILRTADSMVYMIFPLLNDKRLLLKIIQEIKNAVVICINSILHYEYVQRRVVLYRDSNLNFRTFSEKCAPFYKITQNEINLILELFDFVGKHKESPLEFTRNDKIVIMSSDMKSKILTLNKTKEFLVLAKNILKKTKEKFLGKI